MIEGEFKIAPYGTNNGHWLLVWDVARHHWVPVMPVNEGQIAHWQEIEETFGMQ